MARSNYHIYTDDELLWLTNNHSKYRGASLTVEFNKLFGTDISNHALRGKCRKIGLRSNAYGYTEDEIKFLKENAETNSYADLERMMYERFGTKHNADAIKAYVRDVLGIKKNAGIRYHGKRVGNYYPVGTRVDRQRTIYLKVRDVVTGDWNKDWHDSWVVEARYVWEQNYGAIPKGCLVEHLDCNYRNNDISNLVLVDNKTQAIMTAQHLRSEHPEITRTAIKYCELKKLVNEGRKEKQNDYRRKS